MSGRAYPLRSSVHVCPLPAKSIVREHLFGYYKVYAIRPYRIRRRHPAVPEEKRSGTADGYSTGARATRSRAITPIRGCLV